MGKPTFDDSYCDGVRAFVGAALHYELSVKVLNS